MVSTSPGHCDRTVRLQRMLARAGVASRRGAEELIREGRVRVNGAVATLGSSVDPAHDLVTVEGRRIEMAPPRWLLLHKPVGYVVSRRDRPGRPTVFELVPDLPGLTYVGRLDVMTSGLLLFTTDGEALHRLTHPRYRVPRSYVVWGHGRTTRSVRAALNAGVRIEGRPVAIAEFRAVDLKGDRVRLELTLTEGRYRIVRRLCAQIGLTVDRLQRRSHGSVHLGRLPEGQWRWLTDREVSGLVGASAGLHQA